MNSLLFLYLKAFGTEGGIEKFNRVFMKALSDIGKEYNTKYNSYSLYDISPDTVYMPAEYFRTFGGRRFSFVLQSFISGYGSDLVVLSHINLSVVGILLKIFGSRSKLILITHGIEVWNNMTYMNKLLLKYCDLVLSVSDYTKSRLVRGSDISADKIMVFPNTIDPLITYKPKRDKPEYLLKQYGINRDTKIIMTVTRLSFDEQYKGYDTVIRLLPDVLKNIPDLMYVIAGNSDNQESSRVERLIQEKGLNHNVILAGFVPSEKLPDYYDMADLFVMPSKGEGFGIVYLESLASGVPVIAGNRDGSVTPLMNGKLGFLVDPDDNAQITETIISVLTNDVKDKNLVDPKYLSTCAYREFGYEKFRDRLINILRKIEYIK